MLEQDDRAQSGPDLGSVAGDAGFAEAFKRLARAASGGAPAPRLQALILVAVNGAVTHPHEPALRTAIRDAPRHGATEAE